MNRKSQSRWIVTLVTVSLAALAAIAPAGAWEDPTDGRQAGNGQGSLPTQFEEPSVLSNSRHEGALAERRVEAVSPDVALRLRATEAMKNDVRHEPNAYASRGVSGSTSSGPAIVDRPSASTDRIDVSALNVALVGVSLAVALLMALTALSMRSRRRILLH